MLIFLTVISIVYFGLHFYVYKRLFNGLELSADVLKYVRYLFWVGGVSFLLGEIIRRYWGISFLVIFGVLWMGLIAIAFSVTVLKDISLLILPLSPRNLSLIALVLIGCISLYSLSNGPCYPRIKEITLDVNNMPAGLTEFRIVQISDTHLDGIKPVFWVEELVRRVNSCRPDLIVITGDLIDHEMDKIRHYVPVLKRLTAPYGIFSVIGNHEYYAGLDNYHTFITECGFRDLSNQIYQVSPFLEIAGIPDPSHERPKNYEMLVSELLGKMDRTKLTIFLSHQPLYFATAAENGTTLQLSGHTHAGQIPPMELIVRLVFKYAYGLHKKYDSYIYTTCGSGFWGPPMRFLSRSEIVLFSLRPLKTTPQTSLGPLLKDGHAM